MSHPYLIDLLSEGLLSQPKPPAREDDDTPQQLRRLAEQARRQSDPRSAEEYERQANEIEAAAASARNVARRNVRSSFAADASAARPTPPAPPTPPRATPRQQREPEKAPPAVAADATAVPDRPRADLRRLAVLREEERARARKAEDARAIANPAAAVSTATARTPAGTPARPVEPSISGTDYGTARRAPEDLRRTADLAERRSHEVEREGDTAQAMELANAARRLREDADLVRARRGVTNSPFLTSAVSAATTFGTLGAYDPQRRNELVREQRLLEAGSAEAGSAEAGSAAASAAPTTPTLPITAPPGALRPRREGAVTEQELQALGLLGQGEAATPRVLGNEGDDTQRLAGSIVGSLAAGAPMMALERAALAGTRMAAPAAAEYAALPARARVARSAVDLAVPGAITDITNAIATGRDPKEMALQGFLMGAGLGAGFEVPGAAVGKLRELGAERALTRRAAERGRYEALGQTLPEVPTDAGRRMTVPFTRPGGGADILAGGPPEPPAGAGARIGPGSVSQAGGIARGETTPTSPASPLAEAKQELQAFYQREGGVKGVPETRRLKDGYVAEARKAGIEPAPYNPVRKVDPDFGKRVAEVYERAESRPDDPEVRRAYRAFVDETMAQYRYLTEHGVRFEFVDEDPYPSSDAMILDVLRNKRLRVFKTPEGGSFHPLLSPEENDIFRAVHDYLGHSTHGHQFGPTGEENAYRTHAAMYSPLARRAMATETRGQNSWVNFGPYGEANRADPKNTRYAEQKVFLMPDELVNEGLTRRTPERRLRLGRVGADEPTPFRNRPDAAQQLAQLADANGGFTVHPTTGATPERGYSVGLGRVGARAVSSDVPGPADIQRMVQANQEFFGGRGTENGRYWFKPSEVFDNLDDAPAAAKARNEDAIFDLNTFTEIRLKPHKAPEGAQLAPPEFQIRPEEGDGPRLREGERVTRAAFRSDLTGKVYEGADHGQAFFKAKRDGHTGTTEQGTQGFTTNRGRFFDRAEATEAARASRDAGMQAAARRSDARGTQLRTEQLREGEREGGGGLRPGFVGDRPNAPGLPPAPEPYAGRSGFYSPARRAVEQAPQRKGDAGYWRAVISKQASKNELEQTGILDWLAQQRGSLTREQVAAALDERALRVEETVLRAPGSRFEIQRTLRAAEEEELALRQEAYNLVGPELWAALDKTERAAEIERRSPELVARMRENAERQDQLLAQLRAAPANEPRYAEFAAPGGRDYQETLIQAPERAPDPRDLPPEPEPLTELPEGWVAEKVTRRSILSDTPSEHWEVHEEGDHVPFGNVTGATREEAIANWLRGKNTDRRRDWESEVEREARAANYTTGPHWREPNVLAHVRTKVRDIMPTEAELQRAKEVIRQHTGEDPEEAYGYRDPQDYINLARQWDDSFQPRTSLHIEEVQSDLNQTGHRMGFDTPDKRQARRLIEGELRSVQQEQGAAYRSYRELYRQAKEAQESGDEAGSRELQRQAAEEHFRYLELTDRFSALNDAYHDAAGAAPNLGYSRTDDWVGLGLRRALQQAVDEGHGYLTLTTPEQITRAIGGTSDEGQGNQTFYNQIVPKVLKDELRRIGIKNPIFERVDVGAGNSGEAAYRYVGEEPHHELVAETATRYANAGLDDIADMLYEIANAMKTRGERFADNVVDLAAGSDVEADALQLAEDVAKAVGGSVEQDFGAAGQNLALKITPEVRAAVRKGLRIGAVGDVGRERPFRPKTRSDVLLSNIPRRAGRGDQGNVNTVGRAIARVNGRSLEGAPYSQMLKRARERIMPELRDAVRMTPDAGAWYGESITRMENAIQSVFPETADPTQMRLFKFILAVTSSGTKPQVNLRTAIGIYEHYRTTGRLSFFAEPPREGKTRTGSVKYTGELAPSVKEWGATARINTQEFAFRKLDALVAEQYGGDLGAALDGLLRDRVEKMQRQRSSGERVRFSLPAAATRLGDWPKIGRFFANLNGMADEVTVDVWAVRTLRGWLGYTRDVKGKRGWETVEPDDFEGHVMRQAMTDAAAQLSRETGQRFDPMDVQALLWYYEKERYTRLGAKDSEQVDYAQAAEVVSREYQPGGRRDRNAGRAVRQAHLDAAGRAARRGEAGAGGRDRAGNTALRQLGLAVAPGVGAAAGAALNPDDPAEGAATGAIAGLGLAALAASRGRGRFRPEVEARGPLGGSFRPAGERPRPLVEPRPELRGEPRLEPARAGAVGGGPPQRRSALGTEYAAPVDDLRDPRLLNLAKFDLDPTGQEYLRTVAQAEGYTKRRVTWDETRAVARELGLNPNQLLKNERNLTEAELLAMRDVISRNVGSIEQTVHRLADPTLPAEEREIAEKLLGRLEHQNAQLLGRFVRERSSAGRVLNSLKIVASRTLDPATWAVQAQRVKGLPLSPEELVQINRLTSAGDRAALVSYVSGLRRSTRVDKALTLWRAGLLTSPTTHLANIMGNTSMAALETLKEPLAGVIDAVISGIRGTPRTKAPSFAGLFTEQARGTRRGVSAAADVWKTGMRPEDLEKWDVRRTNFDSPFLQAYTDAVFNSLSAEDQLFRSAAVGRALAEQVRVRARDEARLNPQAPQPGTPAFGQRVAQLAANPPDDLMLNAIGEAEIAVFQNDNPMAKWISSKDRAFQNAPFGRTAVNVVIPFVRTPTNVGARLFDYSPFGLLSALGRQVSNPGQKRLAEDLARSFTGSGLVALGISLAAEGKATGSAPVSGAERDQWVLEGKGANSVLIDGHWVNIARITPAGTLVALGAQLYQTWASRENAMKTAGAMALAPIRTATDQTFLRGVSGALEVLNDPVRYGESYAAGTVGSVIPSAIARASRAFTPTEREGRSVGERFLSRTPARVTLPERTDVFGRPLPTPGGSFPGRLLVALFDPFNTTAGRDSPVLAKMRELGFTVGKPNLKTYDPTVEPKMGQRAGVRPRSDEELRAAIAVQGPALERSLTAMVEDSTFNQLSPRVQYDMLKRVESVVRSEGEAVLAGEQDQIRDPEEIVAEAVTDVANATVARRREPEIKAAVAALQSGGSLDRFSPEVIQAARARWRRGLLDDLFGGTPSPREAMRNEENVQELLRQERSAARPPR